MCGVLMRMFIGLVVLMPAGVFAATIQLPKTGQTGCFQVVGNEVREIDCSSPEAAGQDANKSMGVALPAAPRFTEPATPNGTLTDKLTDLVWLKNADCLEGARTWQEALDRARNLASGACGLSDSSVAGMWRVPNLKEIQSLSRFSVPDGAEMLNTQGFVNGVHDWYWTSDTYLPNPSQKWVYHLVGDAHPNDQPTFRSLFVRDLLGLTITPATQDFGSVAVQQSAPATITLANTSSGPVTVSGITFAGTDATMFTVAPGTGATACASLTPTIQPAANCTVTVTFAPTSPGAKTATLRVASNADSPATDLPLTGAGTAQPTQAGLESIIKVYQSVLGKAQLTDAEKAAADVAPLGADGKPQPDGTVDTSDVVILLRRLIGVISW